MNLIKNATVYRATLPSAAELAEHLAECPFVPVLETMQSSAGFIQHPTTEKLVTEFPGGLAFRLRQDVKPISLRAINLEHEKQISAKTKELDRELSKEEVDEIKVSILSEAVKSTLPERVELDAFYHIETRTLILPTSNKNMASTLLHKLVLACAAIESSTIHVSDVKGGLTTRLRDHFDGSEEGAFNGFKIGDSVVMKGEKGRASFDLDNLDHAKSGVLEALAGDMQVERLELCHADVVNFKLTKDFQLRGITYIAGEDDELPDFESLAEMWAHNAGVQVLLLSATVKALCDLFGYQEKSTGTTETHGQKDLLDEVDPLYAEAVAFVRETMRCSISSVQRKLQIGYNRAARLVERLEAEGVVTAMNTNGSREVIRHG